MIARSAAMRREGVLLVAVCFAGLAGAAPSAWADGLGDFNTPAPGAPRPWQGGTQVTP